MLSRLNFMNLAIFIVPAAVIVITILFTFIRAEARELPEAGLTGYAELASPQGEIIGIVNMVQGPGGVLVQVQAENLAPGRPRVHSSRDGHVYTGLFSSGGETTSILMVPETASYIRVGRTESRLERTEGISPTSMPQTTEPRAPTSSLTAFLSTLITTSQSLTRTGPLSSFMRSLTFTKMRNRKPESESPAG